MVEGRNRVKIGVISIRLTPQLQRKTHSENRIRPCPASSSAVRRRPLAMCSSGCSYDIIGQNLAALKLDPFHQHPTHAPHPTSTPHHCHFLHLSRFFLPFVHR